MNHQHQVPTLSLWTLWSMNEIILTLPHVNATLNGIATLLLIAAFVAIMRRNIQLHKNLILSAFGVSAVFLICYLFYHYNVGSKKFPADDYASYFSITYYVILATHVVLAMFVPFLAVWAIYLGLKDQRQKHRKVVRWAFPIWLYVSVTGVLVYFMLYWWFPPIAVA